MKEIHVKPEQSGSREALDIPPEGDRRQSRGIRKGGPPLQSQLVATVVEIYWADSEQPVLGAEVSMREVPPELDPKNISAFHREEDSDAEDQKPVNNDLNFSCWYVVDKKLQVINFSILLGKQQINMRTPHDRGPQTPEAMSLEERQRRVVVARNYQYIAEGQENLFLKDFKINQNMAVYALDLKTPVNFSRLDSFHSSARKGREIWERDLGR